jgi:transposase
LDAHRAHVDQLLAEGVWNAQVIFRELQARGYTGKLSILRDYIRPKRALRPGRVTVRFETEPGRQLQSDWGEIRTVVGGIETEVHFCVNTLGYSRRFHFWCTDQEDAEHPGRPIKSFRVAFRSACKEAGCPGRVLHDFRRTAVRNLVRAGIPERIAMQMTGHKTRSVFERYNIVSVGDLREAAKRLDAATGTISGTIGPNRRSGSEG